MDIPLPWNWQQGYDKGACKTWTDAETARLKNAWGECANAEGERFVTAQLEYAAIIVQPFFDLVQENLGVDMKRSRALLEMSRQSSPARMEHITISRRRSTGNRWIP